MSYPKMLPCPRCLSTEHLAVYSYDNGWRHVECDSPDCPAFYLGPGEGSIRQAIESHNRNVRAEASIALASGAAP